MKIPGLEHQDLLSVWMGLAWVLDRYSIPYTFLILSIKFEMFTLSFYTNISSKYLPHFNVTAHRQENFSDKTANLFFE